MSYPSVEKIEVIAGQTRAAPVELPPMLGARRNGKANNENALLGDNTPAATVETRQVEGGLSQTYVRFIVDPNSSRVRVQVLDATNDEVIREIPPEVLARLAEDMKAYNTAAAGRRA